MNQWPQIEASTHDETNPHPLLVELVNVVYRAALEAEHAGRDVTEWDRRHRRWFRRKAVDNS